MACPYVTSGQRAGHPHSREQARGEESGSKRPHAKASLRVPTSCAGRRTRKYQGSPCNSATLKLKDADLRRRGRKGRGPKEQVRATTLITKSRFRIQDPESRCQIHNSAFTIQNYSCRIVLMALTATRVSISYGVGGGLGIKPSISARSFASKSRILASTSACFCLLRTMSSR